MAETRRPSGLKPLNPLHRTLEKPSPGISKAVNPFIRCPEIPASPPARATHRSTSPTAASRQMAVRTANTPLSHEFGPSVQAECLHGVVAKEANDRYRAQSRSVCFDAAAGRYGERADTWPNVNRPTFPAWRIDNHGRSPKHTRSRTAVRQVGGSGQPPGR